MSDKELGLLKAWQEDIYNQALSDLRNGTIAKLQDVSKGEVYTWDFVAAFIQIITDKTNEIKK